MEYVIGEPLIAYCNSHSLSIPDRLKIFRQICDAVQTLTRNSSCIAT
jgi:hypothetical protein